MEGPDGPVGGAAAQRKPLATLALLAAAGPRGVSRDKVLGYLWPEIPSDRATHRLTQVLYSIRHQLCDDLVLGSNDLRLNPDRISTDLADFNEAVAQGFPDRAVEVYGGPFLDGFFGAGGTEFEQWIDAERSHWERRYRAELEKIAERATQSADPMDAVHCWGRLAQADPFNSHVAVHYIEALVRAGDRVGGLRFAQIFQARLREELDVPPDPAVEAAVARLRTQSPPDASVCVLPFLNLNREDENDYFCDGMTEELTNALTQLPGLQVASRTSAFAFKGKNLDLREIGQRLGVRNIVEGSVRKVGNRIRVTAQLVDAVSGFHRWSQTFERTLHDVFALQEEISQAIVRELPLRAGTMQQELVRPPTPLVEAYTLYLRGRYFALKRKPESLRLAIEYFEQAIELDPGYAVAHAGIGECYVLLGFEEFGDEPPSHVLPRARTALERALALDPNLAEGHTWRAVVAFLFEYDWAKAETSFLRALQLKPTYSLAHVWYGVFLGAMARNEEALTRLHYAEQLDPLAVSVQAVVAHAHYFVRDYGEALQRYLAVSELEPENPRIHAWIARLHHVTGQFEHGLKALTAAMQRSGRSPLLLAQLGRFYAALGRPQEAHRVLEELRLLGRTQYVSAMARAYVHRSLGNQKEMYSALDQAYQQRSGVLPFLAVEPGWEPVHHHSRFKALIQRMGLDQAASRLAGALSAPAAV